MHLCGKAVWLHHCNSVSTLKYTKSQSLEQDCKVSSPGLNMALRTFSEQNYYLKMICMITTTWIILNIWSFKIKKGYFLSYTDQFSCTGGWGMSGSVIMCLTFCSHGSVLTPCCLSLWLCSSLPCTRLLAHSHTGKRSLMSMQHIKM